MKLFKQFFVAVVLGLCGLAANAQQFIPMDPGAPGQFNVSWSFDDAWSAPHVAGDFIDVYQFNVPDAQNISVSVWDQKIGGSAGVGFYGFGLFSWADYMISGGNPALLALGLPSSPGAGSVSGGSWLFNSGTYGLALFGTYTANGASYQGIINGVPASAVPEPAEMLMMMAGLMVVAGALRRRRNAA